jgi:heptosyltransferase I
LRVLIVRIGAMGDVLHALPAVAALRALRPEWEIGWAIEPRWSGLLAVGEHPGRRGVEMPLVDRWHRVATREWQRGPLSRATVASVLGLRRELRAGDFDVCVDMQGSIRSAVVGWMAGAERLVGMAEPREGVARILYQQRVKVTAAHVVEQGCELLGAAVGEVLRPAKVVLPVDAAAEAWCDGLLDGGLDGVLDGGLDGGLDGELQGRGRFVVIAPTAGWGAKTWPAERYGAVAKALVEAGFGVLVNAVPGGDAVADAVVRASGGAAVAVACTVGQMIALVRRADLVIAGDTGPLHLAAALERPVMGIYGPTDPARTGPYRVGKVFPGRVLRDASSVTDHSRIKEPEAGMLRIGVDEVVAAALEVLG